LGTAISTAHGGFTVYSWLVGYIRKKGHLNRADEIKKWLESLGCLSESAVRQLVEDWAATLSTPLGKEMGEELIDLLINLTRGARFLTTNGTPRSSYLRCEKLIDQLLTNLQPVRKRGQLAGPGFSWRLERYLGQGTFGEVWLGQNTEGFPKPWAFKFFTHQGAQEWVRKEKDNLAQILKRLGQHPNIIEFLYVAVDGQPWPFLALEYAGGGSLEDWILEDPSRRPKLNKHEIIRGVILGLSKAHDQGIFHRDLKPANILLTHGADVRPKIADFGLAKVATNVGGTDSAQVSQAAQVGTSMYLPPEAQEIFVEREPAQDDVFALGVLWYQLVVERLERPPYNFSERLLEHQIDTHTIRLISRCLAHPNRRFRDACNLLEELEEVAPTDWIVPPGLFDVQHIVREYLGSLAG
jgi:serine/threonine protein kinase